MSKNATKPLRTESVPVEVRRGSVQSIPQSFNEHDNDDVLKVGGKPINLSTLTDISQFLSEQNNQLDV